MFKLAHLSDIHLGPLPTVALRDLMSKRMFGYANWRRSRSRRHRGDVLVSVIDHLHTQAPDHIAVTGDLINIALPAEFAFARHWLADLGDPHAVSVVPGNHDAYIPLPTGTGFETWSAHMRSDDAGDAGDLVFPYVRRVGRISLIGVSSAVPASIFKAVGRLGPAQLGRLADCLEAEARAGRHRVMMIHHPPHATGTKLSKRLEDGASLMAVLKQVGVDLVIYGHNHRFDLSWHEGPDGVFPAIGVPSASAATTATGGQGGYHWYEFQDDASGMRVTLTRFSADPSGTVRQIGEPLIIGGDDQTTVAALLKASAPRR